ncbi:peptide chain release factor N(5)-glutamine methyltransferase [Sphingomicrobium marinum]|uniref:peptide chain release factor N(5)-glutamine methyltransferase n=1 Tax=Sphingomicrobium marinum TaxID=1227950 RepID=UPI00223FE449|nr:peptide chain release factor N(5)-glutamine methyltransferase [Sphingomicrobium marinum]
MSQRALDRATNELKSVSDTPRLDAELLLAAAFGIGRDRLLLDPPQGKAPPAFEEMVKRRVNGEPIAYITGQRAFWTIDLEVGPGVLIPRPDSETLIEAAVEHFGTERAPARVLDLGTGPGTLLLAALDQWPDATGIGVDVSETALDYARRNAKRIGIDGRAQWRTGDWADGVEGRFDLILCNPPYVADDDSELDEDVRKFEPAEALFAGADGLDQYRRLIPQLPPLLADGGLCAIEIGHRQGRDVAKLLQAEGQITELRHDLGGRPRAVLFRGNV